MLAYDGIARHAMRGTECAVLRSAREGVRSSTCPRSRRAMSVPDKAAQARELDQLSTQCTYVSIAKNDVASPFSPHAFDGPRRMLTSLVPLSGDCCSRRAEQHPLCSHPGRPTHPGMRLVSATVVLTSG
eukprot:3210773-Rhodomonas_salina.3